MHGWKKEQLLLPSIQFRHISKRAVQESILTSDCRRADVFVDMAETALRTLE